MAKNKKFHKVLKDKSLKRKELASHLGVSEKSVENWMYGRNRPSILNILAMSKLFNMTIEDTYRIFK